VKKSALVLAFFLLIGGVAFASGDHTHGEKKSGDFLYVLLFWVAVVQGCMAVGAVATFAGARWIDPVKRHLLSVYPMLWVLAGGFAFFAFTSLDAYSWVAHPGRWLNKDYFVIRNIGCMVLTALLGTLLAREAARSGPKRVTLAVLYLFSYVTTQSLVAFDWVMSLEYPWYSTLFGGFFFMEALLTGFAISGIFWFCLSKKTPSEQFEKTRSQRRDMAALQFGFSVFWAYLMYSQILVIWYGNLPEETTFFHFRLKESPIRELLYSLLGLMFAGPFVTLISRKAKETPVVVIFASFLTLSGMLIERVVYLAPNLHLNPAIIVPLFLGFAALFVLSVKSREKSVRSAMPNPVSA
jgi:hypothetical protein